MKIVDAASESTIGRMLKKHSQAPPQQAVSHPPEANAAFVAAMKDVENVLDVYKRPHDPSHPLVCLDGATKQLIKETRLPLPLKPGQPVRYDCEYERNGKANLFMMFAPLEGWRRGKVTECHTTVDYTQVLKDLSDLYFPNAKKVVLVQDNP